MSQGRCHLQLTELRTSFFASTHSGFSPFIAFIMMCWGDLFTCLPPHWTVISLGANVLIIAVAQDIFLKIIRSMLINFPASCLNILSCFRSKFFLNPCLTMFITFPLMNLQWLPEDLEWKPELFACHSRTTCTCSPSTHSLCFFHSLLITSVQGPTTVIIFKNVRDS